MKLKPCPFCGKQPGVVKDTRWPKNRSGGIAAYHVECVTVGCPIFRADTTYYKTEAGAILKWNTRKEGTR